MAETDNTDIRTHAGELISPPIDPHEKVISQTSKDMSEGTQQPLAEESTLGTQIVKGLLLTFLICIFVLLIIGVISSVQKGTSGVVFGGFLFAAVISFLLVKIPKLQISSMNGLSPDVKFTLENEARKTLAQIIGGMFLLVGIYGTLRSMQLSENAQFVGRFDRAVDQLGNEKQQIRIGGVFALIRLSEGEDEDKQAVREIFLEHIREIAGREDQAQENLAPPTTTPPVNNSNPPLSVNNQNFEKHRREMQLIIDSLGDSIYELEATDLSNTKLKGLNFNSCQCTRWNFRGSYLDGAVFNNSRLLDSVFAQASLKNVSFINSYLEGANFEGADLSFVDFSGALLSNVNFDGADLRGANLSSAGFLKSTQIEKARNFTFAQLPEEIVSELKTRHPDLIWPSQ